MRDHIFWDVKRKALKGFEYPETEKPNFELLHKMSLFRNRFSKLLLLNCRNFHYDVLDSANRWSCLGSLLSVLLLKFWKKKHVIHSNLKYEIEQDNTSKNVTENKYLQGGSIKTCFMKLCDLVGVLNHEGNLIKIVE